MFSPSPSTLLSTDWFPKSHQILIRIILYNVNHILSLFKIIEGLFTQHKMQVFTVVPRDLYPGGHITELSSDFVGFFYKVFSCIPLHLHSSSCCLSNTPKHILPPETGNVLFTLHRLILGSHQQFSWLTQAASQMSPYQVSPSDFTSSRTLGTLTVTIALSCFPLSSQHQ